MKKILLIASIFALQASADAQFKIGDNPNTISASTVLELESTDKGLLLPRVDPANVTSPVQGLMVYDIVEGCLKIYDGAAWSSCLGTPSISGVDRIQAALGTNLAAYNAAAAGTWVPITTGEYIALENSLSEVTRTGSTQPEYAGSLAGFNWGASTSANAGSPMPEGSYLFAFKVRSSSGSPVPAGSKVKISNTGPLTGFADIGTPLPTFTGPQSFFVLKGSNTPTASSAFMGFYTSDPNNLGYKLNGGVFYETSDASNLPNVTANFQILIQGLSTTIKQW